MERLDLLNLERITCFNYFHRFRHLQNYRPTHNKTNHMSCKVEELQSDITKGKVNDTTQCLNKQEEE